MVRLKESAPIFNRWVNVPFQFQYGAIKSLEEKDARIAELEDFNSNMVRLKAYFSLNSASFGSISIPIWCD